MCSDLYKPLKNKQLNKIAKYYKFDLENSVNKSLFFKNFSGMAPGTLPPREGAILSRTCPHSALCASVKPVPTHHNSSSYAPDISKYNVIRPKQRGKEERKELGKIFYSKRSYLFVCLWFFVSEFFTHLKTSPLPVKSCEGSLASDTYCDTGHPFIMVISESPVEP